MRNEYSYDAVGRNISVRDALGNTTTYTYNSLNQLVSVKDAKNNTVIYGYDALVRRTTITDAKNNVFTTTYDGNGNVLKTIDAKGNTISETVYNCLKEHGGRFYVLTKCLRYGIDFLGDKNAKTSSKKKREWNIPHNAPRN